MAGTRDHPFSDRFALERLAEGVWAAIGHPAGAYSNAGIIDLGNETLVFDTFMTPAEGRELRTAAESLTGNPIRHVVISHAHSDHWLGNQVFVDATILTSHAVLEDMRGWAGHLQEVLADSSGWERDLEANRKRLETETDPRWRASLEVSIARNAFTLASFSELVLRLPDATFERQMVFYGRDRRVEVRTKGAGHSPADVYLVLPADGVVLMGDLGFFQVQPFVWYADFPAWKRQLASMEASGYEVFVPGHGPVGRPADLALQREYLEALERIVGGHFAAGGTLEAAFELELPSPLNDWLHGSMARWEANVWAVQERFSYSQDSDE